MKKHTCLFCGLALTVATLANALVICGESSFALPIGSVPIHVEIRIIEADESDYLRVSGAHTDSTGSVTNHNAVMRELGACKNTDLLMGAKIEMQPGQISVVKQITEYTYPTTYDMVVAAVTNGTTASQVVAVEPQNFVMREVGNIFSVLPEFKGDNGDETISVHMRPSITGEPEWKDYGAAYSDSDLEKIQFGRGGEIKRNCGGNKKAVKYNRFSRFLIS